MPRAPKTASVSLSVNPTSILQGEWARLTAVVTNTSSSKLRVEIDFFATDPDDNVYSLGFNRANLAANAQILITTAYPTATDAVTGTHVCEVRVSAGGTQLATDTENVTVS